MGADLCEMKNLWPCYDFIGEVSNISSDIQRLDSAVAEKVQIDLEPILAQGWGTKGDAALFPKGGREDVKENKIGTRGIVMVSHQKVELTEQEVSQIKHLYADDYKLIAAARSGAHGNCRVELNTL